MDLVFLSVWKFTYSETAAHSYAVILLVHYNVTITIIVTVLWEKRLLGKFESTGQFKG